MSTPRQEPWTRGRGRGHVRSRGTSGGSPPQQAQARYQAPRSQALQTKPSDNGRRRMELIASVSRSSGLERDGDALRDSKTQEEYREFIQSKVDEYWKTYPLEGCRPGPVNGNLGLEQHKKEMEGNLLILFRKLREGLMSIQRRDAFAREVYETSLHLSVLFKTPVQTTSALSHLFPSFYLLGPAHSGQHSRDTASSSSQPPSDLPSTVTPSSLPSSALPSALILLLHHLVASYPSQVSFYTQLRQLHPSLQGLLRTPLADDAGSRPATSATSPPQAAQGTEASQPADRRHHVSSAYEWITELARCLRRRNYARLEALTRRALYEPFVRRDVKPRSGQIESAAGATRSDLAVEAVECLVDSLLEHARGTTWKVLRTAYREVSLRAVPSGAVSRETTARWLACSLVLRPADVGKGDEEADSRFFELMEAWLGGCEGKNEARRKEGEGMEGRWILVKP